MSVARLLRRGVRTIVRVLGVVVGLFGLLLASTGFPPGDAETGAVFLAGCVVLVVALGMIFRPESVRFGNRDRIDPHGRHRR